MESIPVILNPSARSATASGRVATVRELSQRIHLLETAGPGDARTFARDLAKQGAPVVVAAGGDGTVNETVNGLADAGPACRTALGLLPLGTMNVFALELGLPVRDLGACWRIVEAGEVREIDLWRLNGHCFAQLAGIGLDAQIIQETTWERKKSLGPLSYVVAAAGVLGKKTPEFTVYADGQEPFPATVLLLGNGQRYGGPLKVFPKASLTDGLIDVVALPHHGFGALFSSLGAVLSGYTHFSKDIRHFQTASLRIEGAEPAAMEADGDFIGTTPAVIEKAPFPLRVVVRNA